MTKIKEKGLVQVSVYLPLDMAEQLTSYCTNNEIVRKNKQGELMPALGTGILDIVKLFFNQSNVQTKVLSQNSDITNLIDSTLIDTLQDKVQSKLVDYINEKIEQLNETLKACYSQTIDSCLTPIKDRLDKLESSLDRPVANLSNNLSNQQSLVSKVQCVDSSVSSVPSVSSGNHLSFDRPVDSQVLSELNSQEEFEEENIVSEDQEVIGGDNTLPLVALAMDNSVISDSGDRPYEVFNAITKSFTYTDSYSKIKELITNNITRTKIHEQLDKSPYPNYPNKTSHWKVHYKWNKVNLKTFVEKYEEEYNISQDNSILLILYPPNKEE